MAGTGGPQSLGVLHPHRVRVATYRGGAAEEVPRESGGLWRTRV